MKARTIVAVGVLVAALAAVALGALRDRGGHVPATARGVPYLIGGPWLRPDTRYGPALDSISAAPAQAAALEELRRLARERGDGGPRGGYCVGVMADYVIRPVPSSALAALREQHRGVRSAERCRFHVETLDVDRGGLWPRRAWLLWATVPEEPAPDRAVLDVGYHAGFMDGAGWRCFLSRHNGRWAVDSTVLRWES